MPDATIIVTIGPYHKHLADRAMQNALQQTWPCTVITAYDERGLGPARARNMALKMVGTNFVVFLDADDLLEREFVAKCLRAWKPGHYVYTDWRIDDRVVVAPDCPWHQDAWHVITTLLPTNAAKKAGFDESLPGAEDRDFYLNLTRSGTCGIHLREPLFIYGPDGLRGQTFNNSTQRNTVLLKINERYGEMPNECCGGAAGIVPVIVNDQQPGDIEVIAMWGGNRELLGPHTRRKYPRVGNRVTFWANVEDVQVWRRKGLVLPVNRKDAPPLPPPKHGVKTLAQALYQTRFDLPKLVVPDVEVKPNVERVLELYRKATND